MRSDRRKTGFTLVELLVVMGIIGLLVTILVPTITKATEAVKTALTKRTMGEIALALNAYKADFGDYPPSRPFGTSDPASGAIPFNDPTFVSAGAANLWFYLMGPGGRGWGTAGGGWMPSDFALRNPAATAPAGMPDRAYGPYFQTTPESMDRQASASGSGPNQLTYVMDAYSAGYRTMNNGQVVRLGRFLYWRNVGPAMPTPVPVHFEYSDNGTTIDDFTNYASKMNSQSPTESYFFEIVRLSAATGSGTTLVPAKFVRDDYLLVSPGPDGRFGYTYVEATTKQVLPWSRKDPTPDKSPVSYDDIVNWN